MYASLLYSVYFLYHDICVLIPICYLSHSFTGGTSKKPRATHPRYVRKTGEGQFMDEDERRRKIVDKVTSKRKGKEQREAGIDHVLELFICKCNRDKNILRDAIMSTVVITSMAHIS